MHPKFHRERASAGKLGSQLVEWIDKVCNCVNQNIRIFSQPSIQLLIALVIFKCAPRDDERMHDVERELSVSG